jgi:hypothetical protein
MLHGEEWGTAINMLVSSQDLKGWGLSYPNIRLQIEENHDSLSGKKADSLVELHIEYHPKNVTAAVTSFCISFLGVGVATFVCHCNLFLTYTSCKHHRGFMILDVY